MPETPVLDVAGVTVRFGGVTALDDVSIALAPGVVTGLIGPNGAGKTTLFDVMTGLRRPDAGTVHLDGRDVTRASPHRRARLGLARTFQRLELFWSLDVADNVRVGAESHVRWWRPANVRATVARSTSTTAALRAVGARTVDDLLERVGLDGMGAQRVGGLPTGSARLVELARALAIDPKVLLLDEPGSGLDEDESRALGDLLAELADGGMAIGLIEHDMDLVMGRCDRVVVLDNGRAIAAGAPETVKDDPEVQRAYLGASPAT